MLDHQQQTEIIPVEKDGDLYVIKIAPPLWNTFQKIILMGVPKDVTVEFRYHDSHCNKEVGE